MRALIVVVAFVTCAVTFARADQLERTPEDSSCEVMPMDVMQNFLFSLSPERQASMAAQRAAEREALPKAVYYPHTDLFPDKDVYLVVYLDFERGLGVYCELKDCSEAEPPPRGLRFGLVKNSDFEKWKCSDSIPSEGLAKGHSCGKAKFHDCSSCGTLVVSNYSGVSIDAELESDPPGIFQSGGGTEAENYYCNGKPRSCRDPDRRWSWGAADSCESVAPEGGRCYETIAFCPEQSGVTRGHLKVTIRSPARVDGRSKSLWENTRTQVFDLVGTASYPPALEAAERVRKRHADELMKIPNVDRVDLQQAGRDILIDVQTKGDIDKVRKAMPPSLEGYKVEVTQFIYDVQED
jgi:hypothetical protein